jgi:hypothetical protein
VPLRGVGAAACSSGRAQTLEFVLLSATLLRAAGLDEQAALSWDKITSRLHKPTRLILYIGELNPGSC